MPTDEFINALPERIKYELKLERDEIISDSANSKSTCTYFEVCKSTLTVEDLKIYPNPAKQSVTIDFLINETADGKISLFNMGGSQVKILVSNTTFVLGFNSFHADLSNVTAGIYIVSVQTEKEFVTRRLIISR